MQFKLYSPTISAEKVASVEEAKMQWDSGVYEYFHTFPDVDAVTVSKVSMSYGEIVVNERGSVFVKMFPDFICIISA